MKTCFSEGKLMKQFGKPPLSKRTPPLSTNPPISEIFFRDSPLCGNFQNKKRPPPPNFRGGRKLCITMKKNDNEVYF